MRQAMRFLSKVRVVVGVTVAHDATNGARTANGARLGGIASTNVFYKFSISNKTLEILL